jgi:hypothetical protein
MSDPALLEAGFQILAAAHPEQPASSWDLLRSALQEGFQNIDRRLKASGPLEPDRFRLLEVNERLAEWSQPGRFRPSTLAWRWFVSVRMDWNSAKMY